MFTCRVCGVTWLWEKVPDELIFTVEKQQFTCSKCVMEALQKNKKGRSSQ
jgi:hypothetical protein